MTAYMPSSVFLDLCGTALYAMQWTVGRSEVPASVGARLVPLLAPSVFATAASSTDLILGSRGEIDKLYKYLLLATYLSFGSINIPWCRIRVIFLTLCWWHSPTRNPSIEIQRATTEIINAATSNSIFVMQGGFACVIIYTHALNNDNTGRKKIHEEMWPIYCYLSRSTVK